MDISRDMAIDRFQILSAVPWDLLSKGLVRKSAKTYALIVVHSSVLWGLRQFTDCPKPVKGCDTLHDARFKPIGVMHSS